MATAFPARRRPRRCIPNPLVPRLAALAVALACAHGPAAAKVGPAPVVSWLCASGNWSVDNCWTGIVWSGNHFPPHAPGVEQEASVQPFFPGNVVVTYDSTANPMLARVNVDGNGLGTATLAQTQGILSAWGETIGGTGTATYTLGGTGENRLVDSGSGWNSTLQVGVSAGSLGTVLLSGNAQLSSSEEAIGVAGRGSFAQSGGSNTVRLGLVIGSAAGGQGSYALSAGTLAVGSETVGDAGSGSFAQSGGSHGIAGDLRIGSGSGTGSFSFGGGTLMVDGNIEVGANGKLTLGGSRLDVQSGRTLTVLGTLTNEGTLVNHGTLGVKKTAQVVNTGTLQNLAGATLTSEGGFVNKQGGTIANAGAMSFTGFAAASSDGAITNSGSFAVNAGAQLHANGSFANAGTVAIDGVLDGHGSFVQTAGATLVGGRLTQDVLTLAGGTLGGSGSVQARRVVQTGGVLHGGSEGRVGTLTIAGDFQAGDGATLLATLGGTGSAQYSRLVIHGDATLGGTLALDTLPGFSFAAGQAFTLVDADTLGGRFSQISYDGAFGNGDRLRLDDGLELALAYAGGDLRLQVLAVPEPTAGALMLCGLTGLLWRVRRRGDSIHTM